MLQDNGGAVVAEVIVVGQAVHHGWKRREYGRAGGHPHIHAQVQRAGFLGGTGPEVWAAAVNHPVLEVAANASGRADGRQHIVYQVVEGGGVA